MVEREQWDLGQEGHSEDGKPEGVGNGQLWWLVGNRQQRKACEEWGGLYRALG